ncbi:MAG: aldehyde:ferredoxin oxidoreductase, partial [Desulfobacterales bacterium]|nr:aldehyde:ferredoxin oxidoreductase [Desulfobacterales bacterium]
MKGFFKRLLVIDLSNRTSRVDPLEEDVFQRYLGGKGLATHLLLERNPKGVDPFDPANNIVFALGSASGSSIWGSCRHGVFSKSPLTGFFGESYSGGGLAIPMNRAGYDAIMLNGASDKPVWLEINDSEVRFHDAADLWGKETFETEIEVKRRVDNPEAGVMVIGPAGENRVRFASIKNDGWRMAGRGGMGAVLGSKKVKALTLHGARVRPHADPDGIKAYARQMLKDLRDHPATHAYRNMGTPMMVDIVNKAGGFPTRYWSEGKYAKSDQI